MKIVRTSIIGGLKLFKIFISNYFYAMEKRTIHSWLFFGVIVLTLGSKFSLQVFPLVRVCVSKKQESEEGNGNRRVMPCFIQRG